MILPICLQSFTIKFKKNKITQLGDLQMFIQFVSL
jgi:hypothetical protein